MESSSFILGRRPALSSLATLVLLTMGGASCGAKPARLWLAPIDGSEINLKLADQEPPPF